MNKMSLEKLIKNVSYIIKDTKEIDNIALTLVRDLSLSYNTFTEIKEKINCAHIKLFVKDINENYTNYDIVLKQNYTENEFVDFLKALDTSERIVYSDSIIWTNDKKYWYCNIKEDEKIYWKFHETPCIHPVCLPDAEKIPFESLVRKLSLKNNERYFAMEFVNGLNLFDKSFNTVKEKVKCVYISYNKNDKSYRIVLRKYYSESEFLYFLRELDIDEKEINNLKGLAWTNDSAIYYEYDNHHSIWRKKSPPIIPEECC